LSYARFLEEVAKNSKFALPVNVFLRKIDTNSAIFKNIHRNEL